MSGFPLKNTSFILPISLFSQADTKLIKTSPTLAVGDFKISIDGGNLANTTNLPVEIESSGELLISLTSAEMNGDIVILKAHDVSGAEWCDASFFVYTEISSTDTLIANALAAYDSPTNAEMEARTIVAANYATSSEISGLNNLSAQEVWQHIVETYSAEEMMRVTFAIFTGLATGGGTTHLEFMSVDGTRSRVTMTIDSDTGDRSVVAIDAGVGGGAPV